MWEISRAKAVRTSLCACEASHRDHARTLASSVAPDLSTCLCRTGSDRAAPLPWLVRRARRRKEL